MAKKYVGWGIAYQRNGQLSITIVPAMARKEAVKMFEILDYPVQNKRHLRRVCIVKYPGSTQVRAMPEQNWDESFEIIKD